MFAVSHLHAIEGSFSLQGGVAQALERADGLSKSESGSEFGFSGYVSADLMILPSVSFGLGTGLTAFGNGDHRLYIDGTHLFARWTPFGASDWNPYVMGGLGFRPFYELDSNHRWWQGDFQGQLGIGLRHPLVKGIDLDLTAFYEASPSNSGNALDSIGARGGVAFPFDLGGHDEYSKIRKDDGKGPSYYTWKSGDTPGKAAAKIYGNARYSFVLTDANRDVFLHGDPKPGVRIRVPSLDGYAAPGGKVGPLEARFSHGEEAYPVHDGDCLWDISKDKYGQGDHWKDIYLWNKSIIQDPALIYPREILALPLLKRGRDDN